MNTQLTIKDIIIEHDLDDEIFKEQLHECIFTLLNKCLTPREFGVLRAKYFKSWTRKQISEYYNLSENRIIQIERKALRKCRRPSVIKILKSYMIY